MECSACLMASPLPIGVNYHIGIFVSKAKAEPKLRFCRLTIESCELLLESFPEPCQPYKAKTKKQHGTGFGYGDVVIIEGKYG